MRSPEKEKELTTLPNVKCFALDVTKTGTMKNAIKQALEAFSSIDVVLNNAGYSIIGPFENTPVENIEQQFNTNLFRLK